MKSRKRFHVLKIEHLSEERQGLVFYTCRCYGALPPHKRQVLDELFEKVGGANAAALRAAMTTGDDLVRICFEYHIGSPNTLYVLIRRFYSVFPFEEFMK